jgi:rubrerythrin
VDKIKMQIIADLKKSIFEEHLAAKTYRTRSKYAQRMGYIGVEKRYSHIADEEIIHAKEYLETLKKVIESK